ncbi:MAG TPA: hypothetical protein VKA00_08960 [Trueperaceae bacterium]|nr:hypothetical protein [Trueperaceae bacterium]
MRRVLLAVLALVPLSLTAVSLSDSGQGWQQTPPPPPGSRAGAASVAMPEPLNDTPTPGQRLVSSLLEGASDQVKAGAHAYHLVCEACHGASGGGLAEGRLSFPPSHQYCERCHHGYNSALWSQTRITDFNSFAIGHPPALRGPGSLHAFGDGRALYLYIHDTMPRYRPGSLSRSEALDVTAFLLALRGDMPATASVGVAGAAEVALRPQAPATP